MNQLFKFSAASLLTGFIAAPAFAAGVDVPKTNVFGNESGHLRLGLAAMHEETAYDKYDNESRVVPLIFYSGERFYWMGNQGGFNFINSDHHQFSGILEIGPDQWERSELQHRNRPPVSAISQRDDSDLSLNFGLQYVFKSKLGALSLKAATDISDAHDGEYYEIGYSYAFHPSDKWTIVPAVTLTQFDKDYSAYYFADDPDKGVGDEVRRISFKLGVTYSLNENWQITGGASLSQLDDLEEKQVIVDDDEESSYYIGFTYKVF